MKRKICFIITSGIHFGRSKYILEAIRNHPDLHLQLVVGASALLPQYGEVLSVMEENGFVPDARIVMTLEGGNSIAMAKTAGIGITEFATAFDNLRPDVVVIRADRYEVLSAAIAAAYMNIPVAHIEGGDVTGTIDESVRHAITKLAHIHFSTNEESKQRILQMGENPEFVHMVGSSELEFLVKNNFPIDAEYINMLGVGDTIDMTKPYLIVMQHPVTSEVGKNYEHVEQTLTAIHELGIPTIWFWPNVDAGTDEISKGIRVFRENKNPKNIRFLKYLPPDQFISLLMHATALVGNSSAGIKEASFLGVPVVNIGTRQHGRMRAHNVVDVSYNKDEIKQAVMNQMQHGPYEPSLVYFKENTSKEIAKILAETELYTQKRFFDTVKE